MIILWWILGILAALLAIIAILLIAPIRAAATLQDKKLSVEVRILGLKFGKGLSAEKVAKVAEKKVESEVKVETEDENASIREKIHDVKRKIYMVRHILHEMRKRLFRKIVFEKLELKIRFGDGNAATTGVEAGIIWGAVGGLVALLNNIFIVEKPIDVAVLPEFNQKLLDLYIDGIIRTRLAHIIIAAIIAVKIYKKYEKI
jgi:hypothetical protein